ncbi:MAG TPA: gliding motility-associated C-terminal domain-containing protein, partial [Cytophagaceae bacterium]
NILVKKGGETHFELNGSNSLISPSDFTEVPGTNGEWVACQLYFANNIISTEVTHTITNKQYDFHVGVMNGGSNTGFRYGYFSDFGFLELGDDKSICKGESVLLNAGFGKSSYMWNNDINLNQQHLSVKDSGMYYVKVTKGTCTLTDSVKVIILPEAVLDLGADTSVCPESNYIIQPNTSFSSYLWQDGSTAPFYTPQATGTYTLKVKNEFGCEDVDDKHITIFESPVAGIIFNYDLETICWDPTVTLSSDGEFKKYLWHTGDTLPVIASPHLPEYTLKITDFNNCIDSTSLVVDCSPVIKVYNLVTPNNDGMNDVFYVEGLQPDKWILEVYNHWGDRVYFNPSYRNEYQGNEKESGIYYYLLRHVEGKKTVKGWMHVIH